MNTLGTNENYIYSIIVLKNLVPAMSGGYVYLVYLGGYVYSGVQSKMK